jgi:hypothetical protein
MGNAAAHVMAVRIVIAIAARIIPTAVAGFDAIVFPFPGSWPPDLWGITGGDV